MLGHLCSTLVIFLLTPCHVWAVLKLTLYFYLNITPILNLSNDINEIRGQGYGFFLIYVYFYKCTL